MGNRKLLFLFLAITLAAASGFLMSFGRTYAATDPNVGVQTQVQSYFANEPVMASIARCESGYRQFDPNGGILYGGTTGVMIGIFQIDSSHYPQAISLGYDLDTVAGNMGYAAYLYGSQGTNPWMASFPCWGAGASSAASTSGSVDTVSSPQATENLVFGMIDPQVVTLQQMLNKAGFTLAPSGPGSPGHETTLFGVLTRTAVRDFQCAKGIACSGDEYSTGYGYANAVTRAELSADIASINGPVPTIASSTVTAIATDTVVVATAGASSAPASSTVTLALATTTAAMTVTPASSSTVITADNPADLAELESRMAALELVVQHLEQAIAKAKL